MSSTPLKIEQFTKLVAALYRGPFQASPWQDFLEELRLVFPACVAVLGLRLPSPGDRGVSYVAGMQLSPENHRDYANRFSALDPLVDLPDGDVVALDDVIPRERLTRSTYYQLFMQPMGHEQVMGFDVHEKGEVAIFVRLIRGQGKADFSVRDRQLLELLRPQFRELVHWMNYSRSYLLEQNLLEQAFSTLAMATIILDSKLDIVHMNRVAEQLLQDGNGIRRFGGKLRLSSRRENKVLQSSLQDLLHGAGNSVPRAISISRENERYPLLMTLKKLPLEDRIADEQHVAIYITAPELRHFDQTQLLIDAFGLTRQEARLVMSLANGKTLDDFAKDMDISKNTARTHLYSAFPKVGVTQQSALVSHVIRLVFGM